MTDQSALIFKYESQRPLQPSIILETMALASKHSAINLAQGFESSRPMVDACLHAAGAIFGKTPTGVIDFLQHKIAPTEKEITIAETLNMEFCDQQDVLNQYCCPAGLQSFRNELAQFYQRIYKCPIDPDKEVLVTLGSIEALSVVLRTLCPIETGVIIFQPFHELYINQANLFYLKPLVAPMSCSIQESATASAVWTIDWDLLEDIVASAPYRVSALIVNSPHNPTGKVFTTSELRRLVEFCAKHDMFMIRDDVYEHMTYNTSNSSAVNEHPVQMPWNWKDLQCKDRVVCISSISKIGTATGWRIGWILAASKWIEKMIPVHENLALQAPTGFQYAASKILSKPDQFYFHEVADIYQRKCAIVADALRAAGFKFGCPEGGYYIYASYTDVPKLRSMNPIEAMKELIVNAGIAAVPGKAFVDETISVEGCSTQFLRFACCKPESHLRAFATKLSLWRNKCEGGSTQE